MTVKECSLLKSYTRECFEQRSQEFNRNAKKKTSYTVKVAVVLNMVTS